MRQNDGKAGLSGKAKSGGRAGSKQVVEKSEVVE